MSKVLGFMKQVAYGLQMEKLWNCSCFSCPAVSMPLCAYRGKDDFAFNEGNLESG